MVLLPTLSSLHAANKTTETRQIVRQYGRLVSMLVIPIAVGFASITEVALRLFGPSYMSGLVPSVIVSVVSGLTALGAVYAAVLLAVGRLRLYILANIVGVVTLAVVVYFSTPYLGLSGPALGRATLMIVVAIFYAYGAWRSGFFELDLRAFLGASISSAPMGAVVFFILTRFNSFLVQIVLLPFAIVAGALMYLCAVRALKLFTEEDFEFMRQVVPAGFERIVALILRAVYPKR